jgi:hypothetical protein
MNFLARGYAFHCGILLAVAVLSASSLPTKAVGTNYGSFVGSTVIYADVTESSGTDPGQQFFKDPQIFGNTLDFNPTFTANSSGGGAVIHDAQLNFDLLAKPGFGVQGLSFSERGDFTMAGGGTSGTMVDVSATFFIDIVEVDNVLIDPLNLNLNMIFSPNNSGTFTLTGAGGPPLASGVWSGSILVNFNNALNAANIAYGLGATRVQVALDNTLTAISETGTQAFIAKKDAKGLSITVVPEPSALALLGLGCLAFLLRRK